MIRDILKIKACLGIMVALTSTMQICGKDVQDYSYVDIPSFAYGKRTGAPLMLSCRDLPYALIFNPQMNCGYVIDMDKMELHHMNDRCTIDVVYGGSWHGDDMEYPYDVGCIDRVRMYRNYFSLQDGNRVVYLDKQGECLRQSLLTNNGSEQIEYSFADIESLECIASFEQFSPVELYGDTTENYSLKIRDEKGTRTAYLFDRHQKELWHRELPSSFADISWDEQHIGNRIFYVIGSKIYVPSKDGIICISQEGIENICYESAVSRDCIAKGYACKMGSNDGVFIRLILSEKSSFWEIVRINKDGIHRSKLAINDANGFLYKWVKKESLHEKQPVVPEEITPQMTGKCLIFIIGKGAKWEYTWYDTNSQTLPRISSSEPVFFHYNSYLKAYIAITKGKVDSSDSGEYKVIVPARMYILKQ